MIPSPGPPEWNIRGLALYSARTRGGYRPAGVDVTSGRAADPMARQAARPRRSQAVALSWCAVTTIP